MWNILPEGGGGREGEMFVGSLRMRACVVIKYIASYELWGVSPLCDIFVVILEQVDLDRGIITVP